jgi:hypothetical protein
MTMPNIATTLSKNSASGMCACEESLRRPDSAVVRLEDAKELLDGEGELHGGL